METCVLITRSDHDPLNHYLFYWTEEVIDFGRKKGLDVQDIKNQRANKATINGIIATKNPKFILFNGHGNPNVICGYNDEKVITLNENHELLKSRLVYARTCFSALGIGKKCSEMDDEGCFIGYSKQYLFFTDEHSSSRPLSDIFANPFKESSNIIPISIMKGNKVKDALEKSNNIYKKYIELYETQNLPSFSNVVSFLKWDL